MVNEPAAVAMAYLLPRQARLRRWLEAWKGYRLPRSSYQQRVNVPDVGSILRQVSELSLLPGGPRLRDPTVYRAGVRGLWSISLKNCLPSSRILKCLTAG